MRALQHHCTALEQRLAGHVKHAASADTTKAEETRKKKRAAVDNALTVLRQQLEAQSTRVRRYKRLAWQLQQQLCAAQAAMLQAKAPAEAPLPDAAPLNSDAAETLAACRAELMGVTAALRAAEDRCTAAEAAQAHTAAQLQHAQETADRHQDALHALQVSVCIGTAYGNQSVTLL